MRYYFSILAVFLVCLCEARPPDLSPQDVTTKAKEIMKAHACQKKLTPELMRRILTNYLEELDPNKTYFIEPDIDPWVNPSDQLLNQIIEDYNEGRFTAFEEIHGTFLKAINHSKKPQATVLF